MKEVIIIRTVDPDGSMFQAIMDALRSRRAEVFELTGTSHDMLTFGDVEIYPNLRTVLKEGEEVHLSHGEFSMLLLLASHPKQVFSKAQLYEAAWGGGISKRDKLRGEYHLAAAEKAGGRSQASGLHQNGDRHGI